MKVFVDRSRCAGEGLCERICPQIFEIDEGVCRTKVSRTPREAESACREAARHCPYRAIHIVS